MTLLRAVFVLIASWTTAVGSKMPWARKLNAVACENLLMQKELKTRPEIAKYDLFLESFKPWRRIGDAIVGRAGTVEWRVMPDAGRMTYAFTSAPAGDLGRLTTARRVAKAALAAFTGPGALDGFSVETAGDRVVANLPLSAEGMAFVIGAFNESRGFTAFRPIEFDRVVKVAREVEADGVKRFEYDVHREEVVTAATRAGVGRWLDGQSFLDLPPGVRFDAIANAITVDLPSPRGLADVAAHGRLVAELAAWLGRAGLDVDVRTEVRPDDAVRVILPWTPAGLDARALLGRYFAKGRRPSRKRFDAPLVVRGLTAEESAMVSRTLDGLAPRIGFARSHPEFFLKAPPRPAPTAAQEEKALEARYPGELLPVGMRRNPAFQKLHLFYNGFGPWVPAGEMYTSSYRGVQLTVNLRSDTLNLDFGRRPDGATLASQIFLAILRRRGGASLENLRALDDGRRIEVPLGRVSARVLSELRVAASEWAGAAPDDGEAALLREWQGGGTPDAPDPIREAAE